MKETMVLHDNLDQVLSEKERYLFREFLMVPHLWQYISYQRCKVRGSGEKEGRSPNTVFWRHYITLIVI